jgi:hypothetical protein
MARRQKSRRETDRHEPMDTLIKIESLLKESSDRFLSGAQLRPDPTLVAEGWQRRFTADEQRMKEAVELYSELG